MSGRGRVIVKQGAVKAGRRTVAKKKRVRGVNIKRTRSHTKSCSLLEKVESCLDSFRYEEAAELCVKAVEREPDSVPLLEEAGPLLLELGHTDHALKFLKRAAELSPEKGHMKFLYLGQLASGEEAVRHLNTAISIMTRGKEGGEGEGKKRGEVAELYLSAQGSKKKKVSDEDISGAYCSLAEVYLTDSCFSSAAEEKCHECCREAVRFAPTNPEAHQLLASCLLSMSRNQEAEESIRMSLSLWLPKEVGDVEEGQRSENGGKEEREIPPYFSRVSCAKILMELQLYDEAYTVLERLLRDDDEVVLVWYLMGWLHVMTKDRDSAHFYLEQASKLVGKTECDDEQVVTHISELLTEMSQQSSEEKNDGEEEEKDRRDKEETMDVS